MEAWLWLSIFVLCGADSCCETQSGFSVSSCPKAHLNTACKGAVILLGRWDRNASTGGESYPIYHKSNDLWDGGVVVSFLCPCVALYGSGNWHKEENDTFLWIACVGQARQNLSWLLQLQKEIPRKIGVSCSSVSLAALSVIYNWWHTLSRTKAINFCSVILKKEKKDSLLFSSYVNLHFNSNIYSTFTVLNIHNFI